MLHSLYMSQSLTYGWDMKSVSINQQTIIFLDRNHGVPFQYKKAVFGCLCCLKHTPQWRTLKFGCQLKPLDALYIQAIKCLMELEQRRVRTYMSGWDWAPTLPAMLEQRISDLMLRFSMNSDKDYPLNLALDIRLTYRTLIKILPQRDNTSSAYMERLSTPRSGTNQPRYRRIVAKKKAAGWWKHAQYMRSLHV